MSGRPDPIEPPNSDSITQVFNHISDAVFALDEEFRFTYLNARAEDLLETDAEDLLGERIWDVYPEAEETELHDAIQEALETQQLAEAELYYEPLDIWVSARVSPVETGLSVYFRDITDVKEHEQELDFRTALLEAQAETTLDGQLVVDQDRSILYYNQRFAELWEIPEEILVERSDERALEYVMDMLADPDEFRAKVEYLYDNPHEESRDEIQLADGRWLDRYSAPVIGENGTHYGRLWVFRDITERKEYEQSIEKANAQLEAATQAGAVGTWEWHIPDDQMIAGPSLAKKFRVDPDVAREGVTLDQFVLSIHEDDRERVERRIEEAIESCGEYEAEYRVWNADDELRWVVARGHVECDEEGNPVTFPGTLIDITQRKQAEQELEESNERLEQFAHAVSHDLQEPLRMVSSYLGLLENRYADELDADAQEYIDFAVDGADRMREMIDDLLAYSRTDMQAEPLEPTACNAVIENVLTDLQMQIEETDAEIVVGDLPTVTADESQLEQVFQNLLSNAIKYRSDEPPHIEIDAERNGESWVFRVEDNGIGMEPDQVDRIFDVSERLHTPDEYPGTGVGLALCEKVIDRHGGEIWVESDPGEGSTFYLTVPAAEETRDAGDHPKT